MAIYMWREYIPQPITTPWIYRNETEGLISLSSDGSTRYTIADKNLWATSTDVTSSNSYGNLYQRWNNYWFSHSWSVTTSSTQVNAGSYWPWNYYSSNIYITRSSSPYWWDSSNNKNLRWYSTWTDVAMQWPCPSGFHIPLSFSDIFVALKSILWKSSLIWQDIKTYLKIPYSWFKRNDASEHYAWTRWRCWLSVWYKDGNDFYWLSFYMYDGYVSEANAYYSTYACPIRPFKNEAVQPNDSWTVIYQ